MDRFEKTINGERYLFIKSSNKTIWDVRHIGMLGELLYSFDGESLFNLWTDYPLKFTKEQKKLFDKENPYWCDFFKGRSNVI